MRILNSNWARSLVAVAISFLIFWFLLSKIDAQGVVSTISNSDLKLILLAMSISLLINVFFGAEKWRRILFQLRCPLPYREVLSIRSGCIPFKVIFPLKSSEALKVFYLHKKKNLSFGRSASSILLDKTLNLLVTLAILLLGLLLMDLDFPKLIPIAGLLIIILFLFSAKIRELFLVPFKKTHSKLYKFSAQLLSSFEEIGTREKIILTLYSALYQFSEFLNIYILFKAVGVSVPFSSVCVFVPLIMIINNFPVTILGLGTREALIVFLFAKFGTPSSLLGAGILFSFVEHIFPVIVGLFFIKPFLMYFTIKDTEILKGSAEN